MLPDSGIELSRAIALEFEGLMGMVPHFPGHSTETLRGLHHVDMILCYLSQSGGMIDSMYPPIRIFRPFLTTFQVQLP